MKILITGGSGFIGGHFTELLLKNGHEVVVLDNYSTGNPRNLDAVRNHPLLTILEGDILTYPGLDELVKNCDIVYHLAAAVGVQLVVRDPVGTIQTNVEGSARVLGAAAKYTRRIVIASTSEVYGKSSHNEFKESDDLLIGCPTHSRWSYACSKLLDEFYLMAYHRNQGLPGTVVRFFNTVGPRQTGEFGMVIPRFVQAAIAGEPLQIYGDGGQSRCFCHVFDTIQALYGLLDHPAPGKIFNIGNVESVTIRELAERVIERLHSKSELQLLPYEKAYEKGFEDMRRRKPSIEAIHTHLNWIPTHNLNDIIDDVAVSLGFTL